MTSFPIEKTQLETKGNRFRLRVRKVKKEIDCLKMTCSTNNFKRCISNLYLAFRELYIFYSILISETSC